MDRKKTIGFIGVGNMGGALARGVVKVGLVEPGALFVSDLNAERAAEFARDTGAQVAASNAELLEKADTVILAVKPFHLAEVLDEIAPDVRPEHLFISIAAGIPISAMRKRLGEGARVIRVMPNTPSMLEVGASAVAPGEGVEADDVAWALDIVKATGVAVEVEESQIDAVTGLSGSGPGYIFRLIEVLSEAGEKVGLSPEVAALLSRQTVLGAATMAMQPGADPVALRKEVSTPNGTTEAGLNILEEGGFPDLIARTVARAKERAEELGKEYQ